MFQESKEQINFHIAMILCNLILKKRCKLSAAFDDTINDRFYARVGEEIISQWRLTERQQIIIQKVTLSDEENNSKEVLMGMMPADMSRQDYVSSLVEKVIFVMVLKPAKESGRAYDSRLRSLILSLNQTLLSLNLEGERVFKSSSFDYSEWTAMKRYGSKFFLNEERNYTEEDEVSDRPFKRWTTVGAATMAGGLLIGVTGGLATPFIASGLGILTSSLGIAGASAAIGSIGSVAGSAVIGTLFGISGAGLTGYKMNRHFEDLEDFEFFQLSQNKDDVPSLTYNIAISGWLPEQDSAAAQWSLLIDRISRQDLFLLHFERKILVNLSSSVKNFATKNAISLGAYIAATLTSAATLLNALSLPIGLMNTTNLLDNPWNIALSKSDQAGKVLARNILAKYAGGRRPVSLFGHGMGARAIVACLCELYKMSKEDTNLFGIVQNVYLFGSCVTQKDEEWSQVRKLVADRFVNCYSENDWLLKLIYKMNAFPAAGIAPINVEGIENIDVSAIISSHDGYFDATEEVFEAIGI
jgi:hypothetical protein